MCGMFLRGFVSGVLNIMGNGRDCDDWVCLIYCCVRLSMLVKI